MLCTLACGTVRHAPMYACCRSAQWLLPLASSVTRPERCQHALAPSAAGHLARGTPLCRPSWTQLTAWRAASHGLPYTCLPGAIWRPLGAHPFICPWVSCFQQGSTCRPWSPRGPGPPLLQGSQLPSCGSSHCAACPVQHAALRLACSVCAAASGLASSEPRQFTGSLAILLFLPFRHSAGPAASLMARQARRSSAADPGVRSLLAGFCQQTPGSRLGQHFGLCT